MSHRRAEVEEAVLAYLDTRARIDAGEGTWADLAAHFTDHAVFIDPAWGRCVGLEEMRRTVFGEAMDGLEGWTFPVDFHLIDGDTVVVKWRQVIPGADGDTHEQSGISTLLYAGDGRFRYEEDLLNMAHVMEDIAASGYQPAAGKSWPIPPTEVDRDFSVPEPPPG